MPYTWTELVRHCARCNRDYRVSQESLDNARQNYPPIATDTEIADDFEYCLSCCNGERNTGEHITSLDTQVEEMWDVMRDKAAKYDALNTPGWNILGLTPRDVFAIAAALEVACDDDDEPYPGLRDALAKVLPVRDAVQAAGYEMHTETSAQSQAYIDGAGPWFGRDDDKDEQAELFEVFDADGDSHGEFRTLDEARGCVEFDRLDTFRIMQGLHIIEESNDRHGSPGAT